MESSNLHQLHQEHQLLSVGNNLSFPSNLLLNNSNDVQELGNHSWINDNNNNHQYLGNYMKEETKFTDLLKSGNLSRTQQENDLSEKLMLKTLLMQSPNYGVSSQFQSMGSPNNAPFHSQIHPTVNISSLRNISSGFHGISSMDMNLQPLDLLSMDTSSVESYSRMQHSLDPDYLHCLNNNGPKRPIASNIVEPKEAQSVSKRQRADSRTSCPPLKVRKEKLGDRIAALQQLVAPFGKTDTASVLMEAIGYIKFLQNQVETLSVPYMKLSSSKKSNNNTMQEGSGRDDGSSKSDLRSGGLCLVPLSCMSYISNDGGGGIWPPHPHNFNPGF